MPKHSDDGTKIMGKAGKVKVSVPIKEFANEHGDLVKILEDDMNTKLVSEAKIQRNELKEVIEKISGVGLKSEDFRPKPKPNMMDQEVLAKLVDSDLKPDVIKQLRQVEAETKQRNLIRKQEAEKRQPKTKDLEPIPERTKTSLRDEIRNVLTEIDEFDYKQLRNLAVKFGITMSPTKDKPLNKSNVKDTLVKGLNKLLKETAYEDF